MPKQDNSLHYDEIVKLMNEGVVIDDKKGVIRYANKVFCDIVGIDPDKIVGQSSLDFWDEESVKKIHTANTGLRRKGLRSTYECILIGKDGEKIPVLASGAPLPDGSGTVGILTDLSSIKKNEKQAAILGRAIERVDDAFILFDQKGNIHHWNQGAKHLFDYGPKQIQNLKIGDLFLESVDPKSESYSHREMTAIKRKAGRRFVSVSIEPIETETETLYLCIVNDMSEYRDLQQGIEEKYQKIQSAYNEFGIMRRKMDYMFELNKVAQKAKNIHDLGNFIVSSMVMLTKADACILRLRDKNDLVLVSNFGVSSGWMNKKKVPLKKSIAYDAFVEGVPQKFFNSMLSEKHSSKALIKKSGFTSMAVYSLQLHGELLGSISLYIKSPDKWSIFEDRFINRYIQSVEIVAGLFLTKEEHNISSIFGT